MDIPRETWLIVNSKSGSNNAAALRHLRDGLDAVGLSIAGETSFPDEDLPTPEQLDARHVDLITIFTGDGSVNAAVTTLYGWGGKVLVLPGGTKNLLSKRLHGDVPLEEILTRVGNHALKIVRPDMIRCDAGIALAGLMAGPGTSWVSVREAMRDFDIAGMAAGASEAMAETTGGAMIRFSHPHTDFKKDYPLIEFTPGHRGMQLDAYHADGAGEFLQQGLAMLRRNFREGPHTRLGLFDDLVLMNCEGSPIDVLIDGEPAQLGAEATFALAPCEVDLLASDHGF